MKCHNGTWKPKKRSKKKKREKLPADLSIQPDDTCPEDASLSPLLSFS